MGLFDTNYAAVNSKKPRKSDRIEPGQPMNIRGLLDAATNIPVVGDILSGGLAVSDYMQGDKLGAAMSAFGVLPFVSGTVAGKGSRVLDALTPPSPVVKQLPGGGSATISAYRAGLYDSYPNIAITPGEMAQSRYVRNYSNLIDQRSTADDLSRAGVDGDTVRSINDRAMALVNEKRDYLNSVGARDFINQQSVSSGHIPQWAADLTQPMNKTAAQADWWERAMDKSSHSINAFSEGIRGNKNAFVLPLNTESKSLDDIARHFSQGTKQPMSVQYLGGTARLESPSGYIDIMHYDSETPVIRSIAADSQGKSSGMGKEFYQAANNWASNNNKIFAPDTGITAINELRKTGNTLAAQVRNGGKPIVEMNTKQLSGLQDIPSLWKSESKMAKSRLPSIKDVTFDGSAFNMTDDEITALIKAKNPNFSKGVGPLTAKRNALYDWLKTATPEEAKKAASQWGGGAIFPAGLLMINQDENGD